MAAAKAMVDKSLGDFSGGQGRQEQQAAVMQLYQLTAEVKVRLAFCVRPAVSYHFEGQN